MTDSAPGPTQPPTTLGGTLRYLGPGVLVAAAVVGSGELIATTKTGAQAGIAFLWLIVLGCFIKVFVQIELGRYTVSAGETTLRALNRIPGPRLRANWIIWLWLMLMPASFAMMGGVIGGVGQAMAITLPLQGDYLAELASPGEITGGSFDDRFWATTVTIFTAIILYVGRYQLLERITLGLVALFTLATIGNLVLLQASPYELSASDILEGLSFQLPDMPGAWFTALATFGIIGVGAVDLMAYPYWCLEKGYAHYAGPNDGSSSWLARARGWVRVMHWDAFLSVVICAITTVAFYLIGVAVLHRQGLDPDGMRMVSTLIAAYEPVFGEQAKWLLLGGAVAVLYSTFMIAIAGGARLFTDALMILGLLSDSETTRQRSVANLSVVLSGVSLLYLLTGWNPVLLILTGGIAQTVLLPVVGFSAVYFRFRLTDAGLAPGHAWDVVLILSCLSFLLIGGFGLYRFLA